MKNFFIEAECKEITGIARTTRWRMTRNVSFPPKYKIGGVHVYRGDEIQDWLDKQEYVPTTRTNWPSRKISPTLH